MTNKDYIKQKYPSRPSKTAIGGVMGCPQDYGLKQSLRNGYYCKEDCKKCWNLEVKKIKNGHLSERKETHNE